MCVIHFSISSLVPLQTNQDCACLAFPLKKDKEASLFIVLDGHGDKGDLVSNELLQQIFDRVNEYRWGGTEEQVTAQFVAAFEGAHESCATFQVDRETHKWPAQESGAVGVAMVLRRGVAALAWSGDSRAIMGSLDDTGDLGSIDLTQDHKLEDEPEMQRILATGAWIRPAQEEPYFTPARVYMSEHEKWKGPGLTMSRSLGDMDADAIGIIPTPEVRFRKLDKEKDLFIVLASDGLWEFISSEDVAQIVGGFLARGEPAIMATRFLIAKAAMAWRTEEVRHLPHCFAHRLQLARISLLYILSPCD